MSIRGAFRSPPLTPFGLHVWVKDEYKGGFPIAPLNPFGTCVFGTERESVLIRIESWSEDNL